MPRVRRRARCDRRLRHMTSLCRVLGALAGALVLLPAAAAAAAPWLTELPLPVSNAQPRAVTSGPDGALWATGTSTDGIIRVALDGTGLNYPTPTVHGQPEGITAGPDGNLWVTEFGGGG